MKSRAYSFLDRIIMEVDVGLTTLFGEVMPSRPCPADWHPEVPLSSEEQSKSEGFMRVDHTGEVCAQALYRSQMLLSRNDATHAMLQEACEEEKDHLAWTHQRLKELDTHRSYLNLYWYTHSFLIGAFSALWGDHWSLGFVEETEQQVSRHLAKHMNELPAADLRSRKIVEQMREDEERHGRNASQAGGVTLPMPLKKLMALQAKVMTSLVYYI